MLNKLLLKIEELIETIDKFQDLEVGYKSNAKDLVTNVDVKIQEELTDYIKYLYPKSKIVGEEDKNSLQYIKTESIWIIDPIDGTANFVKKRSYFGMLLAYYENGVGKIGIIVDVCNKKIFVAKRGCGVTINGSYLKVDNCLKLSESFVHIDPELFELCAFFKQHCFGMRYFGACSLDGLEVLLGKAGLYLASKTGVWDMAAHHIFAAELGFEIVNLDGSKKEYYQDGPCIIANKNILSKCNELGLFELLKYAKNF